MFKSLICLPLVATIAMAASTYSASAQAFDASSVKLDEALASRVPAKIKSAGALTIGSDTSYAPWEFLSEKDGQTPEGIDVDMANAIGKKLGLKIEYQTSAFDAILPALGSKFDLGMSAFTITNERMKVVNFISYYRGARTWLVRAGNPTKFDAANICGTKLAIQSGTSQEKAVIKISDECVAGGKAAVEMLSFKSQPEAQTRVAAGGADATIAGGAQIAYAAQQSKGLLETIPAVGEIVRPGQNGIAVNKADMELAQLVADTMNSLIADGTYGKVMAAWGQAVTFDKAEINPVVEN
ncbi:MAG: ABC transporter substrate-binding protein [Rhizobium sp.]|nr:ABC transporter substrate-binding protein [Rhizobium sp.]